MNQCLCILCAFRIKYFVHHHLAIMQTGHFLTRSDLTLLKVSSVVYPAFFYLLDGSFCCPRTSITRRSVYMLQPISSVFPSFVHLCKYCTGFSYSYLLIPWCTVLLEKLTGSQLVKKFLTFYENRRFITAFTSARHLSLSWAGLIQSMNPHSNSWRSILILSSHLCLGLPSVFFPLSFPHQTPVHASPLSPTCYVPRPSNLDFITGTIFGEEYRSWSSSLWSVLHSPVTKIPLTLYSQTLSA
jgi:hypothetical protein